MPQEMAQEMAQEALPRDAVTAEPSEADYDEFCATVMGSARGRAFLSEYARRHRNADTEAALTALRRIEEQLRGAPPSQQIDRVRDELRALIGIIREAQADFISQAASEEVVALLDLLERRIVALIGPPAVTRTPNARPAMRNPESPRPYLTVVPPSYRKAPEEKAALPQEPEPAAPGRPALLPEVNLFFDAAVPTPAKPEPRTELPPSPDMFPDEIFAPAQAVRAPQSKPNEVMRQVMALSEEERIALFS